VGFGTFFHIGGPFASSACITYIFDTHGKSTTEAFVATSLFKSIFIFFASQYVPHWFAKTGAIHVYKTLMFLNLGFSALTIPMYIYGKRLRGAVCTFKIRNVLVHVLIRPTGPTQQNLDEVIYAVTHLSSPISCIT
jgi:hypothetical protein